MKALASNRLAAASSRMADSTACGSQYKGALSSPTTIASATAALTLTSGDEPPATSPTAVRESAPVTTKPWNRPAATLAAPKPTSSRLGSTSRPPRPAGCCPRLPAARAG
ncbi:hypothetical protein G6F35_013874 [Rhizopus arrhizus]|nr:hypothetical protein G6F35_013874 [Rhizopus arrhizus]